MTQPPETLKEFASFCGKNQLHFISDEIYAKSIFSNTAIPTPTPFVSTLALDLRHAIDPSLMHVLYGASKDFCANGLRLGFVCTRNEGILGAMSSIRFVFTAVSFASSLSFLLMYIDTSMFSWSSHVLQDVWAAMLEDKQWVANFTLRKSKLMAENYNIARSFFSERRISHYES